MDSTERAEPSESQPPAGGRRRRTLWGAGSAVVVVGFVVLVVTSTQQAAVPVGASGDMGGMQMPGMPAGGSGMQMTMRDIDGRVLRVPNGRPGVAVFITPRNCADCIEAVRAAARTVGRARPPAQLTVISFDSATSRSDVRTFARTARSPGARYVIDDRSSSLASMFKASGLGDSVVYDSTGEIVGHPTSPAQIGEVLAMAATPTLAPAAP